MLIFLHYYRKMKHFLFYNCLTVSSNPACFGDGFTRSRIKIMDIDILREQISRGEDSSHQFKVDVKNSESLASEMAAFANSEGGTLCIGVADDGSTPGLNSKDVGRINQLISNAVS